MSNQEYDYIYEYYDEDGNLIENENNEVVNNEIENDKCELEGICVEDNSASADNSNSDSTENSEDDSAENSADDSETYFNSEDMNEINNVTEPDYSESEFEFEREMYEKKYSQSVANSRSQSRVRNNDRSLSTRINSDNSVEVDKLFNKIQRFKKVKISKYVKKEDLYNPLKLTAYKHINELPMKLNKQIYDAQIKNKKFEYDTEAHEEYITLLQTGLIPVTNVKPEKLMTFYDPKKFRAAFGRLDEKAIVKLFGSYISCNEILARAEKNASDRIRVAKLMLDKFNSKFKDNNKVKCPNAFTKSLFFHNNITFHSPESLYRFMFEDDNYLNYDVAEILEIDQSRLFFDIDMKHNNEDNEKNYEGFDILEKDMVLIAKIRDYISGCKVYDFRGTDPHSENDYDTISTTFKPVIYGRFDVRSCYVDYVTKLIDKHFPNDRIIVISNSDPSYSKKVSSHLYIAGIYFKRCELVKLKQLIDVFDKKHETYIDKSVYKELHQMMRHSLSGKLIDARASLPVKQNIIYKQCTCYPQFGDLLSYDALIDQMIEYLAKDYVITINYNAGRTKFVGNHRAMRIGSNDKKSVETIISKSSFNFDCEILLAELDQQFGDSENRFYGYKLYRQKKLYVISVLLQLGKTDNQIISLLNKHPRIKSDGSVEDPSLTNDANIRDLYYIKQNFKQSASKNILEYIRLYQPTQPLDLYCKNSECNAVEFSDMIIYLQTSVILVGNEFVVYVLGEGSTGNLMQQTYPKMKFKEQEQFYITFYFMSEESDRFYTMHVFDIIKHFRNYFTAYQRTDLYSKSPTVYSMYKFPTKLITNDENTVELDSRIERMLNNLLDADHLRGEEGEKQLKARKNFILDSLAYKLQNPDHRFHFGIIITGRQGTGKTTFFKLFEEMIPGFACSTLSFDNTQAMFNTDDANLMVAVYNEVGCTVKDRGKIKGLIDDEYRVYNEKFLARQRLRNLSLKFFVSNQTDLKLCNEGDRRFITFHADKQADDINFFKSLYVNDHFDTELIINFQTFLLQRDVKNFDNHKIPDILIDDALEMNSTKDFLKLFLETYDEEDLKKIISENSELDKEVERDEYGLEFDMEQENYPSLCLKNYTKFNEEVYVIIAPVLEGICNMFKKQEYIEQYKILYDFWITHDLKDKYWNPKNINQRLGDGDGKIVYKPQYIKITDKIKKYYRPICDLQSRPYGCFLIRNTA